MPKVKQGFGAGLRANRFYYETKLDILVYIISIIGNN